MCIIHVILQYVLLLLYKLNLICISTPSFQNYVRNVMIMVFIYIPVYKNGDFPEQLFMASAVISWSERHTVKPVIRDHLLCLSFICCEPIVCSKRVQLSSHIARAWMMTDF